MCTRDLYVLLRVLDFRWIRGDLVPLCIRLCQRLMQTAFYVQSNFE